MAALHHATDAILDVAAIVVFFGGEEEISRALKKHNLGNVSLYAVRQWKRRQRIPLNRQLDLQVIAKHQQRPFRLAQYFLPAYKVPAKRKAKTGRSTKASAEARA